MQLEPQVHGGGILSVIVTPIEDRWPFNFSVEHYLNAMRKLDVRSMFRTSNVKNLHSIGIVVKPISNISSKATIFRYIKYLCRQAFLMLGDAQEHSLVKAIEFPPEYQQAGVGILSYFGTYLREQYPEEKAKVKIEQDGLTVRQLLTLVSSGLAAKSQIIIDNRPTAEVVNSINISGNFSSALGTINELEELIHPDDKVLQEIEAVKKALEVLKKEQDPEKVKESSSMSKFKRLVDKLTEGNSEIKKAVEAVSGGVDIIRDLAGKYNSIAQWCGLPQVPKVFTK